MRCWRGERCASFRHGAPHRAPNAIRSPLLFAVFVPTLANTVHLLGVKILPDGVSPTPMSFALRLIPLAWGVFRDGLHERVEQVVRDVRARG